MPVRLLVTKEQHDKIVCGLQRQEQRAEATRDLAAQERVDIVRQERRNRRPSPEFEEEDMRGLPCSTKRVRRT